MTLDVIVGVMSYPIDSNRSLNSVLGVWLSESDAQLFYAQHPQDLPNANFVTCNILNEKLAAALAKVASAAQAVDNAGDSCAQAGAALFRLDNAKIALANLIIEFVKPDQKEST